MRKYQYSDDALKGGMNSINMLIGNKCIHRLEVCIWQYNLGLINEQGHKCNKSWDKQKPSDPIQPCYSFQTVPLIASILQGNKQIKIMQLTINLFSLLSSILLKIDIFIIKYRYKPVPYDDHYAVQ